MLFSLRENSDMWAIRNEDLEVQVRTRPRGGYSILTQVAIKIMATGEIFG